MSDYFPRDVLVPIFARLPVKSILRFRCLSKGLHSLFIDENFITKHTDLNNKEDDDENVYLIYRHFCGYPTSQFKYLLHYAGTFEEHMRFQCPFSRYNHNVGVVGSCKGLMCLYACPNHVLLWNPLIRRFLRLPEASVPEGINGLHVCAHGFGFDPRNKDYRVVRVMYRKRIDGSVIVPGEAEIYGLRKGCWRKAKNSGPTLFIPVGESSSQACVNGVVHWIAENDDNRFRRSLVSFDMCDEVFGLMELPDEVMPVSIAACRGSLLVLGDEPGQTCCVWVMKEYGVAESWTKIISCRPVGLKFTKAVTLLRSGEVLLSAGRGELVLYDPEGQEMKKVGPCGPFGIDISVTFVDTCIDSLLLLGQ